MNNQINIPSAVRRENKFVLKNEAPVVKIAFGTILFNCCILLTPIPGAIIPGVFFFGLALIICIIALCQNHILGGLICLGMNLIGPLVAWCIGAAIMTLPFVISEYAEKNRSKKEEHQKTQQYENSDSFDFN